MRDVSRASWAHAPVKVLVQPHDPNWISHYESEASELQIALGEIMVRAHHIGSTSIPDIWAKPILDILLEVKSIETLDRAKNAFLALGYEALGEYGIAGRRYFRKSRADGTRSHHIHAYAAGDFEIERHLAFRDFLLAHPKVARQYSGLKRELAKAYPNDKIAYVQGKDSFVRDIERRALRWRCA